MGLQACPFVPSKDCRSFIVEIARELNDRFCTDQLIFNDLQRVSFNTKRRFFAIKLVLPLLEYCVTEINLCIIEWFYLQAIISAVQFCTDSVILSDLQPKPSEADRITIICQPRFKDDWLSTMRFLE